MAKEPLFRPSQGSSIHLTHQEQVSKPSSQSSAGRLCYIATTSEKGQSQGPVVPRHLS